MHILNNTAYRLTYKSGKGYTHDVNTLEVIKEFKIPETITGEGWGLSHIGHTLVMDDGSSSLFFIDPDTFKEVRRVNVHFPPAINNGADVTYINELEFAHGELFANVWQSNIILRIDPMTGLVLGTLNLTSLVPDAPGIDVLNGIAFNRKDGLFYVTGKFWPSLFAIKVHLW